MTLITLGIETPYHHFSYYFLLAIRSSPVEFQLKMSQSVIIKNFLIISRKVKLAKYPPI